MRRSSALLVVSAVCVGFLAGCASSNSVGTVQVQFVQPEGAKVTVMQPRGASPALAVPGHLNLPGAQTYRLKLHDLPNQTGVVIWGRLTVEPVIDYTLDCAVPLEITRDDIEDAKRNVLVVKVVFLPDEQHQVYAIPGAPTSIVSTRLEPGKDAVEEAKKQGKILIILRLGGRQ